MESRPIWANRYAIFDEIASGAMATVYLAGRLGQENRRRIVAVKKLSEEFAKEPEFVAMFLDEARLSSRVRHPNVVETYQVLRVPGSLAIVLDLVVGVSLGVLLRASRERGQTPPLPIVGSILAGALRGLHAAHSATDELGKPFGLVHRDVSPGNILVGADGVARVIDFGIAKAAGRLQVTEAGMTRGNASYMAPEQLLGKKVDRRTDVYAAGAVLWESLTGRQLFPVSSDTGLLGKRASGLLLPSLPSAIHPKVAKSVDALVMRALAYTPDERFSSAEEMAAAIEGTFGNAPPAEVAHWVEDLARAKLGELRAKMSVVEEAFARGELGAAPPKDGVDARGWSQSLVVDAPNLDLTPRPSAAPAPVKPVPNPAPVERRPSAAPARPSRAPTPRASLAPAPPRPRAQAREEDQEPSSPALRIVLFGLLALIGIALGIKGVLTMLAHP